MKRETAEWIAKAEVGQGFDATHEKEMNVSARRVALQEIIDDTA